MSEYPFTTEEIAAWYRAKQTSLLGSPISIVEIVEGPPSTNKPAARADFEGVDSLGQICGAVSGEFDFHVLRCSDDKDIFLRTATVPSLAELESIYSEFLDALKLPRA